MKKKGLRGFAIILVLATLVLLAMLSLTYIKLALIDRNIARNYVDNKRAQLIAQSGVDYAIARVQEDPAGTGWVALGDQKSIKINGANTNYTESTGSTYGQDRDIFKVEVRDCNSMINVNDGLGNAKVTADTKRILNVLGVVKGITNLGNKIIDNRLSQGYASKQELLKAISAAELDAIKELVTTHAWQDPNVVNPAPLNSRFGRGKDNTGATFDTILAGAYKDLKFADGISATLDHAIYGLDELNPQWVEIVSRSPVNINTAKEETLITLLWKLKGIFLLDKRSSYPGTTAYTFSFLKTTDPTFTYSPTKAGSELGYLYSTEEIDSALAQTVTQEIKNCREKLADYSDTAVPLPWFRGPFKTWRQFNAFCDYLYSKGVISDSRAIFSDGDADASAIANNAQRIAGQAKADVLKANFNPNLHLNESNSDANIATLVDKTALIVNSTEFCFAPMGYFEMESEGFILKPRDTTDNFLISNAKITALVKLYDIYRESTQSDFLNNFVEDESAAKVRIPATAGTNNGKMLEIGPEPAHILDAGQPIAKKNSSSGYIQLATLNAGQPANATFIAHYSENFSSDYINTGGTTNNITSGNAPDPTEATAGPYIYSEKNRLVKGYKKSTEVDSSFAPTDQRIDGIYIERHSGLAYSITTTTMGSIGHFSYWIKPSFRPEFTAKPRSYLSLTYSYTASAYLPAHSHGTVFETKRVPVLFGHYFLTSYSSDSETTPGYGSNPYYRMISFLFCYSITAVKGEACKCSEVFDLCGCGGTGCDPFCSIKATIAYGSGYGKGSPVLNHQTHADGKVNYFKQGQWTHVAIMWDLASQEGEIRINGASPSGNLTYGVDTSLTLISPVSMSKLLEKPLRIGEPALSSSAPDLARNWTSDSTVDEFCIYSGTDTTNAIQTYNNGRYFKPQTLSQSWFKSKALDLSTKTKLHPLESIISDPAGSGTGSSVGSPQSQTKILGLSWTWYAEESDNNGRPILKNYKIFTSSTPIYPKIKIKLVNDAVDLTDEKADDGYSLVNLTLNPGEFIRYQVVFNLENSDGTWSSTDADNTVLLYTPVFDDITIYYTQGTQFVSYHCE